MRAAVLSIFTITILSIGMSSAFAAHTPPYTGTDLHCDITTNPPVPGVDYSNCDLSPANLSGANLSGANLSGADLFVVDLSGANLSGADLTNANLQFAFLVAADLSGANLSGADLTGASLFDADLTNANLSGADLSGANLFDADLTNANLSGADLSGADLTNANLSGAYANPACIGNQIVCATLPLAPPMIDVPVGGIGLPIDTTALFLATAQSTSLWMLPVLAGIGIGVFVIKKRF